MMHFLGNMVWFFVATTFAIIFLCTTLLGLAVLDYLLDSDIKGALVKELGPRPILKKLKDRVLEFLNRHDGPSKEDMMAASMKQYEDYILSNRENKNYNEEVHSEIEKIFKDVEETRNNKQ